VTNWPSTQAQRVLAALTRLGWSLKRQSGSHRVLSRDGGSCDIFLVVKESDADALLAALRTFKGDVIQTTLGTEVEEALRESLR